MAFLGEKHDRHSADNFFIKKIQILVKMSLKFVPDGTIDNIVSIGSGNGLSSIRRRTISEPLLTKISDAIWINKKEREI